MIKKKTGISLTMSISKFYLESILSSRYWVSKMDWGWGDRSWDGWMASLTQWTWIEANSRRQWRTGKVGMLQMMGSQRAGRDLTTEQQQDGLQAFQTYSSGRVWMWELDCKEGWVPKSWCFWIVVLEKTLESPLDCKEIQPVNPKENQSWIFIGKTSMNLWKLKLHTLATWCKELIHWKRPRCWERLKAGGEGDNRGWDGWMASLTHWTWVWASSRSWWWTGKLGVLQSMGLQRVRHGLSNLASTHSWMV